MENISIVKEKCVGCRSCEQICPKKCIDIKPNYEGFLYPSIKDDECIHCGLCIKACPTKNEFQHRNEPISVWGFKNKSEDIMQSASGGAADVATKTILNKDGVVYGAAYNEDLKVEHIEVNKLAEKYRLQSSKYVQSDINDCYTKAKIQLIKGKKVLFTGTPCQIAGLYSFLGKDYPNLITIDLICHGVPSPKLFEKYLEYQSDKLKEKIVSYNFRSKDKRGWGTQYLLKTKTKTKTKTLALDKYGKHFLDGDCYRECCYQCPYANTNRVGDITVGDFWGINKCHPEFFSSKGVSSVFVNTEKGNLLFSEMKNEAISLVSTLEEGLIKQGNLKRPTKRLEERNNFYLDIDNKNYVDNLAIGFQFKERIKTFIPNKILLLLKRIKG